MNQKETLAALAENVGRLLAARSVDENRVDLAKRIGIGSRTLQRILEAGTNPELSSVVQLAAFLRVEPWELLRRPTDEKLPTLDVFNLAESIGFVSRALDRENISVPKHLQAQAIALVYSKLGNTEPGQIYDLVVALVRKS